MSRPWMPFYWGDWLRDTGHLSPAAGWGYLHLIGHYWNVGNLPVDEQALRRISRLSRDQWRHNRDEIAAMFKPGWRHERIEDEIKKQEILRIKRQMAGHRGGDATRNKRRHDIIATAAFAGQTDYKSQRKILSFYGEKEKKESSSRRRQFESLSEVIKAKGWTNE